MQANPSASDDARDVAGAGMKLASSPIVPSPTSRYLELKEAHLQLVARDMMRRRPRVMLIGMVVVGVVLALARFPAWRIATILFVNLAGVSFGVFAQRKALEGACDRHLFVAAHVVGLLQTAVALALTGGVRSPFMPSLIGHTMGVLSLSGRSKHSTVFVAVAGTIALGVGVLPESVLGPPIAHPWDRVLGVFGVLLTLAIARLATFAINDAYRAVGEALDRAREEVVTTSAERARSLEQVGARVAHELKNPLAAIKGLAQLLSRSAEDARSQERLRVITDEVTRMEVILRDYLNFGRPLEELRARSVALESVVDDVIAVLEARAEAAGVTLSRSGAARLECDPRRLKEALLNLAANALEATPEGGAITIQIGSKDAGAEIVVRDTGRGMGADALARIGTPYFTTRAEGTGLGVVLARAS
jgi:anti-sigma regulatory factor (Ser/Thr protein kinase)